jgi:hypothetical protein
MLVALIADDAEKAVVPSLVPVLKFETRFVVGSHVRAWSVNANCGEDPDQLHYRKVSQDY